MNTDWKNDPLLTLESARAYVRAILAERRYDNEQRGTVACDGMILSTSRDERESLAQAVSLGLESQRRKLADGSWGQMTARQLQSARSAAQAYVQSLYDAEAAESAALDHLDLATILTRYP